MLGKRMWRTLSEKRDVRGEIKGDAREENEEKSIREKV
jgi:hypothetical protein